MVGSCRSFHADKQAGEAYSPHRQQLINRSDHHHPQQTLPSYGSVGGANGSTTLDVHLHDVYAVKIVGEIGACKVTHIQDPEILEGNGKICFPFSKAQSNLRNMEAHI